MGVEETHNMKTSKRIISGILIAFIGAFGMLTIMLAVASVLSLNGFAFIAYSPVIYICAVLAAIIMTLVIREVRITLTAKKRVSKEKEK